MSTEAQLYESFNDAYEDIRKTLKGLTIVVHKLPKTKGVLATVINVFKDEDDAFGLSYDKFVEQFLITKNKVKNVTDHDYIPSKNYKDSPLPTGLELNENGEIVLSDTLEERFTHGKGGDAIKK
jgi:hypothetical protein